MTVLGILKCRKWKEYGGRTTGNKKCKLEVNKQIKIHIRRKKKEEKQLGRLNRKKNNVG
jgi:hypothetical protein